MILRGGDADISDENNDDFYTAIGLQIVGAMDDSTSKRSGLFAGSSNFILLQDDVQWQLKPIEEDEESHTESNLWQGDAVAVESLAIACDIMVVVIVVDSSSGQLLDPEFVRALEQGLLQRAGSGMISSVLILLVNGNSSKDKKDHSLSAIKDRLVLQDLSRLTPNLVTSLELLSLEDPDESTQGLATVWKELLREISVASAEQKQTTAELVPVRGFSKLLHGIYQSKGGNQTAFLQSLKQDLIAIPAGSESDNSVEVDPSAPLKQQSNGDSNDEEVPDSIVEVDPPTPLKQQSKNDAKDEEETLLAILNTAQLELRDLEGEREQLWLEGASDSTLGDIGPSAHFGNKANKLLQNYQAAVKEQLNESSHAKAEQMLLQSVLSPLKQLYDQHVKYLREEYGKRYEAVLEETIDNDDDKKDDVDGYQERWKAAAAQATESFRAAAQTAVPTLCQAGGPFRDADFDYVPALQGLLTDMMQATEEIQELLGISERDDVDDDTAIEDPPAWGPWWWRLVRRRPRRQRKHPAKWYEKVAAKAFVFGVNYFQGWLAYQGIKRAAAQRDLHLPKFPLF